MSLVSLRVRLTLPSYRRAAVAADRMIRMPHVVSLGIVVVRVGAGGLRQPAATTRTLAVLDVGQRQHE